MDLLQSNIEKAIDKMIEDIVTPVMQLAEPDDLFSVTLSHDSLGKGNFTKDVHITQKRKLFNIQRVLNKIYKLSQSHSSFLLDGRLTLSAIVFKR